MKKLKILLIDDDLISIKLIKAMLANHKDIVDEILEASNGKEALDILESNEDINLILLDIIMPIMNGREFLKVFRSQKRYSNIPVIILTTDDSQKRDILNYGADNILIKPIKEDELLNSLKYWLED
jgi:putative two-component system response regulator